MKLLIVGFGKPGHMGHYLASAATRLGLDYQIIDAVRPRPAAEFGEPSIGGFVISGRLGSMNSGRTFYRFPQSCARTSC